MDPKILDIPQEYLDEAVRRLNAFSHGYSAEGISAQVLARTLRELGWKPPVDPVLKRAREIVAQVWNANGINYHAQVLGGERDSSVDVQAVLIALREGMGE